jgi:short-subunit dehydrogenase
MYLSKELNTVLVTGGTRGVGLEIAKMFKLNNFDVVITGRDKKYAQYIAKKLNNEYYSKSRASGYKLDFLDLDSSSNLLNKLDSKKIKPSYVINNAGVLMLNSINELTEKQLHTMFRVNTFGPMLLTKLCKESIWNNKEGGILFNSPPYKIDEKTTHLMPYMQSKLAQTTFMKSLANSIPYEHHNILVSSFWTNYPLLTDAIIKRKIGKEEDCMHPKILADTVKEIVINTENRIIYNGKEIIDEEFLIHNNKDLSLYQMSKNVQKLDQLFMKHLIK